MYSDPAANDWQPAYRLYVIEFTNGLVKAGITAQPGDARIKQYQRPIARHMLTAVVSGFPAEADLLRRLSRVGTLDAGREWFRDLPYVVAEQIARQVASRFQGAGMVVTKNPATRQSVTKLSFNDQEIAVLDAYCRRFGRSRAVASRELAMAAVSDLLASHGSKFCPREPLNTTPLSCEVL